MPAARTPSRTSRGTRTTRSGAIINAWRAGYHNDCGAFYRTLLENPREVTYETLRRAWVDGATALRLAAPCGCSQCL